MNEALFTRLANLEARRRPFVLATVVDTGGSTPRLAGAQMAVEAAEFHGTVGGGAFEQQVIERSRALLADPARRVERFQVHLVRDLAMCCGGRMEVFMQTFQPTPRLRIYGAGHVGTALATAAHAVGFEVRVVDERDDWADPARFPDAVEVVDADPIDDVRARPPGADEYLVVLTHSHPLDEALIRELAERPCAYLGLIGSRGKWARFRKRLEARGLSVEALDKVRCPVGLAIHAETPEEIAVSIVAELIAVRRSADVAR